MKYLPALLLILLLITSPTLGRSVSEVMPSGGTGFDPWNQTRWADWYDGSGNLVEPFEIDVSLTFATRTTSWWFDSTQVAKILGGLPSVFLVTENSDIIIDGNGIVIDTRPSADLSRSLYYYYTNMINLDNYSMENCFLFCQSDYSPADTNVSEIHNMTIKGFSRGIAFHHEHRRKVVAENINFIRNHWGVFPRGQNGHIVNCVFKENTLGGFYCEYNSYDWIIEGNTFKDNDTRGVKSYGDIVVDACRDFLITGNVFQTATYFTRPYHTAISLYRNRGENLDVRELAARDNMIIGNTFHDYNIAIDFAPRQGVASNNDSTEETRCYTMDNTVNANTFYDCKIAVLLRSNYTTIKNNMFNDCNIDMALLNMFYAVHHNTIDEPGDDLWLWSLESEYSSYASYLGYTNQTGWDIPRSEKFFHIICPGDYPVVHNNGGAEFLCADSVVVPDHCDINSDLLVDINDLCHIAEDWLDTGTSIPYTNQTTELASGVSAVLIGDWSFEENTGQWTDNAVSGQPDLRRGSSDSAWQDPEWSSAGYSGNCFHFISAAGRPDGETDFLRPTSAADLSSFQTSTFTVEAWIKLDSIPENTFDGYNPYTIISFGGKDSANANKDAFFLRVTQRSSDGTGILNGYYYDENGTGKSTIHSAHLEVGQWYHVGYSHDGSATIYNIAIWVDGVKEVGSSANHPRTDLTINGESLVVGAMYNRARGFNGYIDEVKFYTSVYDSHVNLNDYSVCAERWQQESDRLDFYSVDFQQPLDIAVGDMAVFEQGDELAIIWDEPVSNISGTDYYTIAIFDQRGNELDRCGRSSRRWSKIVAGNFLPDGGWIAEDENYEIAAVSSEPDENGYYPIYIFHKGFMNASVILLPENTNPAVALTAGNFTTDTDDFDEIAVKLSGTSEIICLKPSDTGWSQTITGVAANVAGIAAGEFNGRASQDEIAAITDVTGPVLIYKINTVGPYKTCADCNKQWQSLAVGSFDGQAIKDNIVLTESQIDNGIYTLYFFNDVSNVPVHQLRLPFLNANPQAIDAGKLYTDTETEMYLKTKGISKSQLYTDHASWENSLAIITSGPRDYSAGTYWIGVNPLNSTQSCYRLVPIIR